MNPWDVEPIDARPLQLVDRKELLALLGSLSETDWVRPTAAGEWTVKHVALHLLDGDLHRLAIGRDHDLTGLLPADTPDVLAAALHVKNQRWVEAAGFLSGRLIIRLLAMTTHEVGEWTRDADLTAPSRVSWASGDPLPAWFDLAREFTETWVHHQQIRHGLGLPTDMARLRAVLRIFAWAFPHQYRVSAPVGTGVAVCIDPDTWSLTSNGDGSWSLRDGQVTEASACLRLAPDDAWRLLVGADVDPTTFTLEGPEQLTSPLLQVRAVIT